MAVVHIIRNKTSTSPDLMAELRRLLEFLDSLQIILRPKYIRSELNPADEFSRLTDRDAWSLRPSLQRMLLRKVHDIVGTPTKCVTFSRSMSSRARSGSHLYSITSLRAPATQLNITGTRPVT